MINSVSFGSNQEQKSNKTKNTIGGAVVGAGAGVGAAAVWGKKPQATDAATLKTLTEDTFNSMKKAGNEDQKKAVDTVTNAIKNDDSAAETAMKNIFEKDDTKVSRDTLVQKLELGDNFEALEKSVNEEAEAPIKVAEKRNESIENAAKELKPEGDAKTAEKEIHINKETGEIAEKAEDGKTETLKIKKEITEVDGKPSESVKVGEETLENTLKPAQEKRATFTKNSELVADIKKLDEKEIAKGDAEAVVKKATKTVGEGVEDAYKTLKDLIPKKFHNKTAAIYAGIGAAAVGLIANLATKKPEGAE